MRELVDIAAALADQGRLRALVACRHGELCACQLIALLGLAPSTVSKHMSILKRAGLVVGRKEGRWMHYRLPSSGEASPATMAAIKLVLGHVSGDQGTAADDAALTRITALDPEELCRLQKTDDAACCSFAPGTRVGARWQKGGPVTSIRTASRPSARARGRKA